jgi:hypothetical protein
LDNASVDTPFFATPDTPFFDSATLNTPFLLLPLWILLSCYCLSRYHFF